jgi:putative PIN family toxin of toxin-antitoxin system
MTRAVLDSAVLISAFLRPGGVADAVLHQAYECAFELFLAEEILAETRRVLLEVDRIRRRYVYPDESVHRFIVGLRAIAQITGSLPPLAGIVERDPNDDIIVACAVAAGVDYIVTRDDDLLSLRTYESITMTTPEAFMGILRQS